MRIASAAIAGVIGAAIGWTFGPIAAAALGGLAAVAALFVNFAAVDAKKRLDELSIDNVSLAARPRLVSVFKLHREICELLTTHAQNPVVAALSADLKTEIDTTLRRAVDLSEARCKIAKLTEADSALEAKYQEATTKMDGALADAESALSQLRSKILMTVAESVSEIEQSKEPLSEFSDRLQRIGKTMEDSVQELNIGGGIR